MKLRRIVRPANVTSAAPARAVRRPAYGKVAALSQTPDAALAMVAEPPRTLDTFDNPNPGRDYLISVRVPEFTCLCPVTGQPDFAVLTLAYIPDARCVELKSLKLYIGSYRNEGAYHEAVTNRILDDVIAACEPRFARLTGAFNVRGGTYPTVVAEFRQPGWQPADDSVLPD